MSSTIENNIAKVRARIRSAAEKYQRTPDSVQLMAVSKTRPASMIREAANCGVVDIGENYLQEALDKQAELQDLALRWHFIGPIQSNKTRAIAEHFDWVHGVDRLKIAQRLNDQRPSELPPINICLQINVSEEDSKSGISTEQLPVLANQVQAMPNIALRGIMAIPQASDDLDEQRAAFKAVSHALSLLKETHPQMDTLSIGMSKDLEAAVAEGASIVRIGTDIFGQRT